MSPGPIARLPPHVLQLIFRYFIPVYAICLPGPDAQAILNLVQVCSCWRQVALETPELWADIELYFDLGHRPPIIQFFRSPLKWFKRATRKPVKRNLCIAVEWLKRANDRPRSLKLHGGYITSNPYMKTWVMAIRRDIIGRFPFRRLDLRLPSSHIPRLFQLPNEALTHVQFLEVSGQYQNPQLENPFPVFYPETRLPNLESICLRGHGLCAPECLKTVLAGNSIRHIALKYYGVQASACLDMLRQCSVIEYFEVFVADDENLSTTQTNTLITLPTLLTLKLKSTFLPQPDCMEPFLRTLTLPNLEKCTIRMQQHLVHTTRFATIFSEMVRRSSYMPRLRQLILCSVGRGIDEVIRYVPSLVSLTVHGCGLGLMNDNVIYDLGVGKLLPRLRRLGTTVKSAQEAKKVLRFATLRVQRCTGDDVNVINYDETVVDATDNDDTDGDEDEVEDYDCLLIKDHEHSDDIDDIEDDIEVSLCRVIRVSLQTAIQERVQLRKLFNVLREVGVAVHIDG